MHTLESSNSVRKSKCTRNEKPQDTMRAACLAEKERKKKQKKNVNKQTNVTLSHLPFARPSVHLHIANAISKAAVGGHGRNKTMTLGDSEPLIGQRAEPREHQKANSHACTSLKAFSLGGGEGEGKKEG